MSKSTWQMDVRSKLAKALALLGKRQRRVWIGTTRAHFEMRELDANEIVIFRDVVSRQLGKLPGVLWVEANPYTRRVVVAFEEGCISTEGIERAIAAAEHDACCAAVPFSSTPCTSPFRSSRTFFRTFPSSMTGT